MVIPTDWQRVESCALNQKESVLDSGQKVHLHTHTHRHDANKYSSCASSSNRKQTAVTDSEHMQTAPMSPLNLALASLRPNTKTIFWYSCWECSTGDKIITSRLWNNVFSSQKSSDRRIILQEMHHTLISLARLCAVFSLVLCSCQADQVDFVAMGKFFLHRLKDDLCKLVSH